MWVARDNGNDINWQDAKRYCENYRGGGYSDWRMPTQDELARLYKAGIRYIKNHIIDITVCCPWASETNGSAAATFDFTFGRWAWRAWSGSGYLRALPVRSGN